MELLDLLEIQSDSNAVKQDNTLVDEILISDLVGNKLFEGGIGADEFYCLGGRGRSLSKSGEDRYIQACDFLSRRNLGENVFQDWRQEEIESSC